MIRIVIAVLVALGLSVATRVRTKRSTEGRSVGVGTDQPEHGERGAARNVAGYWKGYRGAHPRTARRTDRSRRSRI